jgi:hypothetical protein
MKIRRMEMNNSFPPFLKWGDYTSYDSKNPDRITVKVTELETFETEYGTNVNALVDGKEMSISLRNKGSVNRMLLRLWITNVKKKKIRKGTKLILCTYLGKSKNDRKIRQWKMEFNS